MTKKQKVLSAGAKKHQGLTDNSKKDSEATSKSNAGEDKENESLESACDNVRFHLRRLS